MYFSGRALQAIASLVIGLQSVVAQTSFWQVAGRPDTNIVWAIAADTTGALYAGTGDGSLFKSTDHGASWNHGDSGLSGGVVMSICVNRSGHVFAGTGSGVFRSTTGGSSWFSINSGIPYSSPHVTSVFSFGTNELLCGAENDPYIAGLFRTSNEGEVWSQVWNMSLRRALGFATDDSNTVYAGLSPNPFDQSSMLRSTDRGQTWVNTGLSSSESGRSVIVSGGNLFCCGITGVLQSSDRGVSWHPGLAGVEAWSLAANRGGQIFVATLGSGVFRSTNTGLSWDSVNTGLIDRNVWSLAIDSMGFLYAGTESGLILRSVQSTTGIHLSQNPPLHDFILYQNYPNPFNPVTTIEFAIPRSAYVTLKIYDIIGRELSALLSAQVPAGKYSVKWDGSRCPSGTYFYRIEVGSYSQTRKLLLIQ